MFLGNWGHIWNWYPNYGISLASCLLFSRNGLINWQWAKCPENAWSRRLSWQLRLLGQGWSSCSGKVAVLGVLWVWTDRTPAGFLVGWPSAVWEGDCSQPPLSLLWLRLTESLGREEGVLKYAVSMPNSGPNDEEAGCGGIRGQKSTWSVRGPTSSSFHGWPNILKRVLCWQSDWCCNVWSVLKKKKRTPQNLLVSLGKLLSTFIFKYLLRKCYLQGPLQRARNTAMNRTGMISAHVKFRFQWETDNWLWVIVSLKLW